MNDINGEPLGLLLIIRDITQRNQSQRALAESEARYRKLIEASPDDIAEVDLEGNFILLNRRAAEMHGFDSVEEMKKKKFMELIATDYRDAARELMEEIVRTGFARDVKMEFLRKDGSCFPVETNAICMKDEN
jgi:PAS domain S-box-containing protein